MGTTNYKQLKQKTFSDGKAEDKVDIYPVIGFDEGAFTGRQTVILPVNHGGTGSDDAPGARANLGIPGELSNLENKLIGTVNDDPERKNTINAAKNYAKNCADTVKAEILGSENLADNLNSIYELVEAIEDNADLINSKVNKTDIYTYDANGNISGGKVGNGAFTLSGGAVGNEAWSGTGFAGGDGACVGFEETLDGGGIQKNLRDGGAIGHNAQAQNGFAGGKSAKAKGKNSIAIGTEANAENPESKYDALNTSISIGYKTQATKEESIAIGVGTQACGPGSIAIGASSSGGVKDDYVTKALATGSVAIGLNAVATGTGSVQLGSNSTTTQTKPYTLNFRQYEIVDAEGRIPSARLYEVVSTLPESATEGTIMFLRQQTI